MLDGLRSVDPEQLKLMRSFGRLAPASTLRSVELPAALPSFFSGLRIAATVSVIGAVFGEWAGADEGLGRLVLLGNNQLQTPRVYAGIVILTLMAVALFALVSLAERLACPWNRRRKARMTRTRPLLARSARAGVLPSPWPPAARRRTRLSPRGRRS